MRSGPVARSDRMMMVSPARTASFGAPAELVQAAPMPAGAVIGAIGDVERHGAELVVGDVADAADALEIVVGEDRMRRLEPLLLGGAFEVEQVRPRPDEGDERHHQLLADRVDRRVGHLREVLLEIGVQQLRLLESTDTGVSLPMEPTASWPAWAIGAIRNLMLSCV